jgi:transcriptional regulator with GAF, ATPase, and Fis domain
LTDSIELQAWRLLSRTTTLDAFLMALSDLLPGRPALKVISGADGRPTLAFGGDAQAADDVLAAVAKPLAVAAEREEWAKRFDRLNEAAVADKAALLTRLGRQDLTEVVGADAGLQEVMQLVDRVSPTSTPVLLLGETGSGKEVVSRAIHARSARASGPIIRVNCAAIPGELVDAELFGHERGSFTGANAARKGWFERADGGTLFLDEIGELPPQAQVRLLRVLQDGTLSRVGGERTLGVDVRLVTATHRDLRAMVASGAFREDLWYRISTFVIRIPPLRRRLQDIPPLAEHFAGRAGLRLAGVPLVPSPADLARLMTYRWPGNVRELAAVIERAAILGNGRRLDVAAALGDIGGEHGARPTTIPPPSQSDDIVTLDRAMQRHIHAALERTRGRIEGRDGAATLLGINPHTLRARMRKLGINWSEFRGRRDAPG